MLPPVMGQTGVVQIKHEQPVTDTNYLLLLYIYGEKRSLTAPVEALLDLLRISGIYYRFPAFIKSVRDLLQISSFY